MFRFFFKSEEERLSYQYTYLMNRSFNLAPIDKRKSDKINDRAQKILQQLRRMQYKELDNLI